MQKDNSYWQDEFGLIKRLLKISSTSSFKHKVIMVPPGDDAGLLASFSKPVVTTDTQKEGVHFSLDWQTPESVGRKVVEITLSDLAASYARPMALFVNLSLPSHVTETLVESIYKGINNALTKYDCALGGGNISRASQLGIDLFAIGEGHEHIFPKRSDACPGDGLYCTGELGLARGGLEALIRNDTSFHYLIERFRSPVARFDAADILAEHRVRCVTDISDGLAGDAGHIAEASNLTIEFELTSCAFHPELSTLCEKYHLSLEHLVLSGGEDYELLFTCSPVDFETIRQFLPHAFLVGRCVPFSGQRLPNLPPGVSSFQHGSISN